MTNFLRGLFGLCALSGVALSCAGNGLIGNSALTGGQSLGAVSNIPYRPVARVVKQSTVAETPRLTLEPKPLDQETVTGSSVTKKPAVSNLVKITSAPSNPASIPLPSALSLPPFPEKKLETAAIDFQAQGLILPAQGASIGALLPSKPNASWLMTPQRQTQASLRRVVMRLANLDQSNADAQSISTPIETSASQKAAAIPSVVTPLISPLVAPR